MEILRMKDRQFYEISPGKLLSGSLVQDKVRLIYDSSKLNVKSKKGAEVDFSIMWSNIKQLTFHENKDSLWISHLILVLIFLQSIVGALFMPHIILHIFKSKTTSWAGYVDIQLTDNSVIKFIPMGWTRLGFHYKEVPTTLKRFKELGIPSKVVFINSDGQVV